MIKNYFLIALRNIFRQKTFAFINITGLAIGLTCATLIMLWIQDELSFDRFHQNAENIYRIQVKETGGASSETRAGTPYPLTPVLVQDFPELETTTRFYNYEKALIAVEDKRIYEDGVFLADGKFLDVFSFPLLAGNRATVLSQPNSIVLTESMAHKYFGNTDPMGKRIRFENRADFTVTGVLADVPSNSHFTFNMLASLSSLKDITDMNPDQWDMYFGIYTYTLLAKDVNTAELEKKIGPALEKYAGTEPNMTKRVYLQPLTGIHLYSHARGELAANNSPATLYIVATIGLLVLFVACINFMNLTTARSVRRAREVGMRKVLGANRAQLLRQYLGESIFVSLIAMFLAMLFSALFLPLFNGLTGKALTLTGTVSLPLWSALLFLTLVVGILSGIYPALVMTSFKPIDTLKKLKSTGRSGNGALFLRKALVIIQFSIAIVLIAGALTVRQQLSFLQNANLGFDKELMLVVQMDDSALKRMETIKSSWQALPGVQAVTASFKSPIGYNTMSTTLLKDKETHQEIGIHMNTIDYDFCNTYDLTFLAGRNFSPDFPTDEQRAVIVNETLVKRLGFTQPQEAIGKVYRIGINRIDAEIIGVVRDFHINSLQTAIKPHLMLYWPEVFDVFSVKIQSDHLAATLASLEATWNELVPEFPFQYRFLDEYINSLYLQEKQTRRLVTVFSGLTIFIACLGLLGLVSFSAEQRTKEVGVRKVLGARVAGLIGLLLKDFTGLVLFANIVAWPVAGYAMHKWLDNFAYRIDLTVWPFIWAGLAAMMIALFTISWQTIRTATANPVEALRYE